MTDGKESKKEKEKREAEGRSKPLGETCKSALDEIFALEFFGREKFLITKEMYKGTAVESDSLTLYEKVTGEKYFKNQKLLENEFLVGTPDVIANDTVIDIKSSWDHLSFAKINSEKAKKQYYWQLAGYCLLTGKSKAEIAYCLVNTPDDLIDSEIYHLAHLMPELENDDELLEKVKRNYIFDDIDPKYRLKRTHFEVLEGDMEEIKERAALWRNYLNNKLVEVKN
jgi:hypothetical protein